MDCFILVPQPIKAPNRCPKFPVTVSVGPDLRQVIDTLGAYLDKRIASLSQQTSASCTILESRDISYELLRFQYSKLRPRI